MNSWVRNSKTVVDRLIERSLLRYEASSFIIAVSPAILSGAPDGVEIIKGDAPVYSRSKT